MPILEPYVNRNEHKLNYFSLKKKKKEHKLNWKALLYLKKEKLESKKPDKSRGVYVCGGLPNATQIVKSNGKFQKESKELKINKILDCSSCPLKFGWKEINRDKER